MLPFCLTVFALPNWNAFLKYSSLEARGCLPRELGPGGRGRWRAGLGSPAEAHLICLMLGGSAGELREPERAWQRGEWHWGGSQGQVTHHPSPTSVLMISKCVPPQSPTPAWIHMSPGHSPGPLDVLLTLKINISPNRTLIITPKLPSPVKGAWVKNPGVVLDSRSFPHAPPPPHQHLLWVCRQNMGT